MSLVKNLFYNIEGLTLEIPEWQIPDEGISALSGPSGSGKTTIFRILLGLVTCKGLEWHFKDCDLAKLSIQDRRLGVVFQSFELFPHLTARENVWFAAKARKISREAYEENLKLFINDLNMKTFIDRKTEFLSGGEKQRVAIARALMGEPRLLLLDEPFSSLDENLKNEARLLLKKILTKKKTPTLLVTHDQRDIEQICDTVFYLKDGKIKSEKK